MRRRDLIKAAGLAAAWPLMARAQQSAMPVVGFLSGRSLASDSDLVAAFSRALNEAGYVNGQNIAIEFRWADGQLNRLPELAAELIERKVAVLFAGASDVAAGALRVAAANRAGRLCHWQRSGCCRSRCQLQSTRRQFDRRNGILGRA
jgi:putative ABC transport system substrate-binding protein